MAGRISFSQVSPTYLPTLSPEPDDSQPTRSMPSLSESEQHTIVRSDFQPHSPEPHSDSDAEDYAFTVYGLDPEEVYGPAVLEFLQTAVDWGKKPLIIVDFTNVHDNLDIHAIFSELSRLDEERRKLQSHILIARVRSPYAHYEIAFVNPGNYWCIFMDRRGLNVQEAVVECFGGKVKFSTLKDAVMFFGPLLEGDFVHCDHNYKLLKRMLMYQSEKNIKFSFDSSKSVQPFFSLSEDNAGEIAFSMLACEKELADGIGYNICSRERKSIQEALKQLANLQHELRIPIGLEEIPASAGALVLYHFNLILQKDNPDAEFETVALLVPGTRVQRIQAWRRARVEILLYGIKNAIKAQDHALVVSLTDRIRFLGVQLFSDDLDAFYLDRSESPEEQLNSVDSVWKSVKEKWDIP